MKQLKKQKKCIAQTKIEKIKNKQKQKKEKHNTTIEKIKNKIKHNTNYISLVGGKMNTRDIIVICLTIVLLLSVGLFIMFNSSPSEKTVMTMTSSSVLNEGGSLVLKLNDGNGTAIGNQRIEINLTHSNGITENFTLKTNSNGECKLEDLPADDYSLIAKYYGNKNYKESGISGNITVKKASSGNTQTSSTNSNDFKTDNKVDDAIDGWDPSEHEVSREDLGDGTQRITYDDGYFRIVDKDGNILTYGY